MWRTGRTGKTPKLYKPATLAIGHAANTQIQFWQACPTGNSAHRRPPSMECYNITFCLQFEASMGKRYKFRGKPAIRSRTRQRCGAIKHDGTLWCRNWPVPGKKRCRFHGGKATGARTAEGKARVIAAMVEGRRKWLAELKAQGLKAPCGRKAGKAWRGKQQLEIDRIRRAIEALERRQPVAPAKRKVGRPPRQSF